MAPRVVLGVDAAWTERQPSGVCLLRESEPNAWECLAVNSSYPAFLARAHHPLPKERYAALLELSRQLAGAEVSVVAVDMPMAIDLEGRPSLIESRRVADNQVSSEFGSRKCSTHSPTQDRPGKLGVRLAEGFGLPLAVTSNHPQPCLLEVYPHIAALALLQTDCRVEYKVAKTKTYWKSFPVEKRRELVAQNLQRLLAALQTNVTGIDLEIPPTPSTLSQLKAHEDSIDALLSGWVGIVYLNGQAKPYGDEFAAIWVPSNV